MNALNNAIENMNIQTLDIAAEIENNFNKLNQIELGMKDAEKLFNLYENNVFNMDIIKLSEAKIISDSIIIATFNILYNYYPVMYNNTRQLRISDVLKMDLYDTIENFTESVTVEHKNLSDDEILYAFGFFNMLYTKYFLMKKQFGKEKFPLFDVVEMDECEF